MRLRVCSLLMRANSRLAGCSACSTCNLGFSIALELTENARLPGTALKLYLGASKGREIIVIAGVSYLILLSYSFFSRTLNSNVG